VVAQAGPPQLLSAVVLAALAGLARMWLPCLLESVLVRM